MPTIAEREESIYRWRAAIKEAHRRRWEKEKGFYRPAVVLSLIGFATVGVIAILFLTHAL